MGFFDKLKDIGEKTKKVIESTNLNIKRSQEVIKIKKEILLKLSVEELKRLASNCGLNNLEYITEPVSGTLEFKRKKIKLDKIDYIKAIANKVSADSLSTNLKILKKIDLANELNRDITLMEEKYKNLRKDVEGGVEQRQETSSDELSNLVSLIVKSITTFTLAKSYKTERDYQIQLQGYLEGDLKQLFPNCFVEREKPTLSGLRLDILLSIDNYKIGIETKKDLTSTGQVQRLLGQIEQYSQSVDSLIIVQYKRIDKEELIRQFNLKKASSKKLIKFIAGGIEI